MRYIRWVVLGASLCGAAVNTEAQDVPGKNLSVDIYIRNVTFSKDTTTIYYMVRNKSTSAEKLESFTVEAPGDAAPITVVLPGSTRAWRTRSQFRDRTVARWVNFGGIAPGDTTPWLSYRAVGLPFLTVAWFGGDSIASSNESGSTLYDPSADQDPDPIADLSVQTWTVGIEKVPSWAATVSGLRTRLADFTASLCNSGVMTDEDLCATLLGHLSASPFRVQGFTASLDSAYTGGSAVSNAAYFLLKPNATYLTSYVDLEGIVLTYVCGNKFRIRNTNYARVPATYSVASTVETGPASFPGRDDSVEFRETFITTTNAGTFHLHYGGNIIVSAANGAVPC